MYSMQAPENWYEDMGTGKLQNGHNFGTFFRTKKTPVFCPTYIFKLALAT